MAFNRSALFDAKAFAQALETGAAPLDLFRTTLKQGRTYLKEHYLSEARAQTLVHAHAWLVDQLLIQAFARQLSSLPPGLGIALVAVGGYGRGELHPASDIDLLLLTARDRHKDLRPFAEGLLHFLWDMGLEVAHSTRSLADCVSEAKKDITVATNLMEARLLAGDLALFDQLRAKTGPAKIWPSSKFFAAKRAEQVARHHRFDDTAYKLEPNVKEGPGGLRDIQTVQWVTQRHYGSGALDELVAHKFLSEDEHRALIRGRDFLWHIRNSLHYLARRREDRLLFDHQRALAAQFGYVDKEGALAVEQLMKRYYRTVKELALLNEILLQHFEEAILAPPRAKPVPINRRFHARNDFLEAVNAKVFERAPFAMLEMFLLLQQHPRLKGVRASTIRLLRENLHRIDDKFRKDLAARSLFMEILRQPRGITHELRRMNAYGVLGAYIPAFGKIVGQMQHDLFHVYTVDEHILFVVRNLRRFTVPEFRHEFPLASELMQRAVKPERLYIAGLFHDIAKGRGGDHSTLGEKDAAAFCRHHGLSEYDTRFVCWLVRHHLSMSATAQRQDIADNEVVLKFAELVGDQEHLDSIYLLTVADMRGTSPAVWNAWKGRLLAQLYAATTQVLRRGFATPIDREAHIADLQNDALARLAGVSAEAVRNFWQRMDADYFLRHDADGLAWHARVIAPAGAADMPLVAARYGADIGGSELMVFAADRPDLFTVLTAGFDRLNLSIVDARIHTTKTGFALDTFVFLDRNNKAIVEPRALSHLEQAMRAQIVKPQPGRSIDSTHIPRQLKQFPIETATRFSLSRNSQLTLMEVTAHDRPGLLYQIALALEACAANLVIAKIATYGERAEDIFFISDRNGAPIGETQQQALDREIKRRLSVGSENVSVVSI